MKTPPVHAHGLQPRPRAIAPENVPATPEVQLSDWPDEIGHTPLASSDAVADLLTELAAGKLSDRSESAAQHIFNLLIEHEVYGVFVAAFEAFNRIQADRAARDPHGESLFKSELVSASNSATTPRTSSIFVFLRKTWRAADG